MQTQTQACSGDDRLIHTELRQRPCGRRRHGPKSEAICPGAVERRPDRRCGARLPGFPPPGVPHRLRRSAPPPPPHAGPPDARSPIRTAASPKAGVAPASPSRPRVRRLPTFPGVCRRTTDPIRYLRMKLSAFDQSFSPKTAARRMTASATMSCSAPPSPSNNRLTTRSLPRASSGPLAGVATMRSRRPDRL